MKLDLTASLTTLDGTELRADPERPLTLREAIRGALEAQPFEMSPDGARRPRPPTMKEVMDRLEIATKLREAGEALDLTEDEVGLIQEAVLVAYTMPVAMAVVARLKA